MVSTPTNMSGRDDMKIDDYDFEKTARAVYVMNDIARDKWDCWMDLKHFMIDMAHTYMHESNSFGTSGFQLTAYKGCDGEINVRASVSGSLAYEYAERVKRVGALTKLLIGD
jgi:hypothetical protein